MRRRLTPYEQALLRAVQGLSAVCTGWLERLEHEGFIRSEDVYDGPERFGQPSLHFSK